MKKIALVICLFVFTFGVFAQTSSNTPESITALKAKIAKLEAQINEDVKVIRTIRAENRALKRELRKLRRAAVGINASQKNVETKVESKAVTTQPKKAIERPVANPEVEEIESESSQGPKKSSVWDHMFPF